MCPNSNPFLRKEFLKSETIELLETRVNDKHDDFRKLQEASHGHQSAGSRLNNGDLSHTVGMFKKYLISKANENNNILGKTNLEESEVIRTRSRILPHSKFYNVARPPSFLERDILPGLRSTDPTKSLSEGKPISSQLTIFYAGAINVYDNVPLDKAHAIMVFAGESSLSKPIAVELPKLDAKKPPHRPNPASNCKLEADLPIARKLSLQHFLEKRRLRITSKYPYCRPGMEQKGGGLKER